MGEHEACFIAGLFVWGIVYMTSRKADKVPAVSTKTGVRNLPRATIWFNHRLYYKLRDKKSTWKGLMLADDAMYLGCFFLFRV